MVVIAWVMLELVGHRPDAAGNPTLTRGDNIAAASWISRFCGARDTWSCSLMRMLGRLELVGGRHLTAKTYPGRAIHLSGWKLALPPVELREIRSESYLTPANDPNRISTHRVRGFLT